MLASDIVGLAANERQAVEGFMKAVEERFGTRLVKRFLFGSKARGDAEEFSDIDILLVVESVTYEERKAISHLSWQAGFDHQTLIVPAIYTLEEYERREDLPFLSTIKREGIPL